MPSKRGIKNVQTKGIQDENQVKTLQAVSATRNGVQTGSAHSSFVMPKHVPLPGIPCDSDLAFEFIIFIFTMVALFLQYLHLYRTVWWLPQSHNHHAMNFYLIDPYLVYFIATLLCRRLIWQVIQGLTTLILPSSISKHVLEFLKLFVIGAIVGNLLWCTYHIFQNHPVMNFCYLFYPFAVYVILFWPCMNAFFDLIPSCEPREDRVKTSKAGLYHTCSSSPQTIRGEVEMLKGDFNLRMRHVLFNSLLNAYYVGFLPCCFAQTALHYDVTWATLHLAYIWVSCFIFHMIHCYPPRYCDTLHRAALHLGRWSKVEGRHAYLPYALWNDKNVWPQGALVKYSRELFRAEGIMNSAVPGDGSQTRFYNVFNNPAVFVLGLLFLQLFLVGVQMVSLLRSSEWHRILSISLLLFWNYYALYKLTRNSIILWRIYRAEQLIQDKIV